MAYRDILVSMHGGPAQADTAAFAAQLAAGFEATLLGAYVSQVPGPLIPTHISPFLPPAEVARIIDAHGRASRAAAAQARGAFAAAAAAHGAASEWMEVEDPAALTVCARHADLMVLASGGGAPTGALSAASLVMAGGGPAILLPPGARPAADGRILVAWNGSREAARALHAAWPIVSSAAAVDVLIVGRGRLGPDGLLQRHFERHGVTPNLIEHEADDGLAGAILRREAHARGAGLIVMGLYGRTRLGEFVFGGLSREFLAEPPAPLFVVH